MKNASQLFLGLLSAIGSTLLVLSAASLALLEGGVSISAVLPTPPTQAPTAGSAQQFVTVTMTQQVPIALTATPTPTEELHCQDTPADWLPYTVQQGDTILSLVIQSGASTDAFLKANCFMSSSMRLEPGWVVYLPPTAPTPTETMTPTPELPTPPSCGAPYNWVNYIVQPGDTLFRLSLSLGISVQQLQSANCLTGTQINAGQMLRVPFIPARPPLATRTPTATLAPEPSDTVVPPTWTNTPAPQPTTLTPTPIPPTDTPTTPPPTETPTTPPPTATPTTPPPTNTPETPAPLTEPTAETPVTTSGLPVADIT